MEKTLEDLQKEKRTLLAEIRRENKERKTLSKRRGECYDFSYLDWQA